MYFHNFESKDMTGMVYRHCDTKITNPEWILRLNAALFQEKQT